MVESCAKVADIFSNFIENNDRSNLAKKKIIIRKSAISLCKTTIIYRKTCLIPTEEGSIYRYDNGISVLTPGKGVDQYRIVVENCKPGYYKAYPDRYMICSAAGKWEPLISHKLCLSKY